MENIELSKRLLKAAEYTVKDQTIADIGSDHAYLPIYLIQQGIVSKAIAGEVVKGPFNNAKRKVEAYNLANQVDVRFGDGLQVLEKNEDIGTIFICGMGGALISDILKNGLENEKLPPSARLVLQPNNAEIRVREFLQDNHYAIIQEAILQENGKIYEVIIAEYRAEMVKYTEDELTFGPHLLKDKSGIFKEKWQQELDKYQHILKQLEPSGNIEKKEQFTHKIKRIQKVIT